MRFRAIVLHISKIQFRILFDEFYTMCNVFIGWYFGACIAEGMCEVEHTLVHYTRENWLVIRSATKFAKNCGFLSRLGPFNLLTTVLMIYMSCVIEILLAGPLWSLLP